MLIFIGLFTSRIILHSLGDADYGTYSAVGGVVIFCSMLTGTVSNAISRFLTFSLGEGDMVKVQKVFTTSILIQVLMSVAIGILVETVGIWWLNFHMEIPPGRLQAARWVLHCSLGVMVVNLLSAPFSAIIVAHEKMSAFAFISVLEALLKLSVALLLQASSVDKLKLYASLLLIVAIIVRGVYSVYCRHNFPEVKGGFVFDKDRFKEISGYVGWNLFSSGTGVLVNGGTSLLVNKYFGVLVNAARGLTTQVEGTVRPFAVNFLSALNPRLTKSYAEGDKEYTFDLVRKGVKIASLLLLLIVTPIILECDYLLELWLKDVPNYTVIFVRVLLLGILVNIGMNSPRQLIISSGKIKYFSIMVGGINICAFISIWVAYALGASPTASYIAYFFMQVFIDILSLVICKRQEGFPVLDFCKEVLFRLFIVALVAFFAGYGVLCLLPSGFMRLIVVTATTTWIIGLLSYCYVLTRGERAFVEEIFQKVINNSRTS